MALPDLHGLIRWIEDDAALAEACQGWLWVEALAVDTEFIRRRTYYPIPALIQVYDGHTVGLIDPLAITRWEPLREVMAGHVVKVFHACSEDLEVFSRLLGELPSPVFDTQIAAGLCGQRPSMGYNHLVQALCEVALPKDETNSDWLRRPLSDSQANYAACDVYYLYAIYRQLLETARRLGRESWVLEDSAATGEGLATLLPPAVSYRRLKGAWRLKPRELAVARALCAWREALARERDLPRNWLLKDGALVELARRQPGTVAELARIAELAPATARKIGEPALAAIAEAVALAPGDWPPPLPKPNPGGLKARLQVIEGAVTALAEELSLAPEQLLSKRQLTAVAAGWQPGGAAALPADLSPWRRALLAPALAGLPPVAEGAP